MLGLKLIHVGKRGPGYVCIREMVSNLHTRNGTIEIPCASKYSGFSIDFQFVRFPSWLLENTLANRKIYSARATWISQQSAISLVLFYPSHCFCETIAVRMSDCELLNTV